MKSKAGVGSFTTREGPGPGEYRVLEFYNRIKGPATFSRHKRMEINSKNIDSSNASSLIGVGPSTYKTNYKVLTRNEPHYVFGTASREKQTFYTSST